LPTPFKFVDRPKVSLKVVSLLFAAVAGFMFWKAVGAGTPTWALWGAAGFLALGGLLSVREFLYRPVRVTTIDPVKSELVVEETAPLRRRRIVAEIPTGARFETYECDSDNTPVFGVRVKAVHGRWVVVGDYLSRQKAEALAAEANRALRT
jgi:hypothetical protein